MIAKCSKKATNSTKQKPLVHPKFQKHISNESICLPIPHRKKQLMFAKKQPPSLPHFSQESILMFIVSSHKTPLKCSAHCAEHPYFDPCFMRFKFHPSGIGQKWRYSKHTSDYLIFLFKDPSVQNESPCLDISVIRPRELFVDEKTMRRGIL